MIDFFGLNENQARMDYPKLYQWLLDHVLSERRNNRDKSFRENWWLWGRARPEIRDLKIGLSRYIATCRTAKFRNFEFIDLNVVPDAKIIFIGLESGDALAILSSRLHTHWADATGGWLGVGNDSNYNHSDCFGKFPFPELDEKQKAHLCELGERLDAFRKERQAEHSDLTMTGMYNVLERLRELEANPDAEPLTEKERAIHEKGLVSVLKQIHDEIDAATFDAYG
ncbi:hypothetical protein [Parvibaculum sp.]|uniref:hypothetical protein n=1 Tax=Parvibaculum sp. TaxID=2024848 RepID=UPI001B2ECA6C|nr:hypothetical protein [Parvibaculum sp.]MBO6669023.1 hypothetical protein [Parvibaculum sp.]MBO6692052.1 hypothetical protein [Parvibaculum sp.]MBO6715427.1 hypothetical protein [Parvibaculum sp.]